MSQIFTFNHVLILTLFLVLSYILSNLMVPAVIAFVKSYGLMDQPDHRKLHASPTPSMGGIAIVLSMLVSFSLIAMFLPVTDWLFITAALVCFSVIGFLDDWMDLNAKIKLLFQVGFSLLGYALGFKLDSAFGLFGIYELHEGVSFVVTMGIYILLINAYNLIDGIDELAGGVLAINFAVFMMVFLVLHQFGYALLCLVAVGAIKGFLRFNAHPAKIFMGDSGSLPLGMIMAILSFKVIQLIQGPGIDLDTVQWILPLVIAINTIPLFDTLRVFALRISKGKSPFSADRNHLHHLLLKNELGHKRSAFFIHVSHVLIIFGVYFLSQHVSLIVSVISIIGLSVITFEWNTFLRVKIMAQTKSRLVDQHDQRVKNNQLLLTLKK